MRTLSERRKAARYKSEKPTMTDQSAAQNTDLHVIINQFLKTGTSPSKGNPVYGDFSQIPTDLRSAIEQVQSVRDLRRRLPDQLKDMGIDELVRLTPDDLKRILTPPEIKKPEEKEIK